MKSADTRHDDLEGHTLELLTRCRCQQWYTQTRSANPHRVTAGATWSVSVMSPFIMLLKVTTHSDYATRKRRRSRWAN